ncbi:MAG: PLD nuclease N-terminal domain-containing protein [Enterococcus sp.]
MIAAVIHIIRHDKFRFGNKALWIIISVFLNIIGPVLYFTIGRSDD